MVYQDTHGFYPKTNSFESMVEKVSPGYYQNIISDCPGYSFKYCSSNGLAYKLEVDQFTQKPNQYSLGTDTCTPGE